MQGLPVVTVANSRLAWVRGDLRAVRGAGRYLENGRRSRRCLMRSGARPRSAPTPWRAAPEPADDPLPWSPDGHERHPRRTPGRRPIRPQFRRCPPAADVGAGADRGRPTATTASTRPARRLPDRHRRAELHPPHRRGQPARAARAILEQNVFGGMCARVCPTEVLCERACVRNTTRTSRSRSACCSATPPTTCSPIPAPHFVHARAGQRQRVAVVDAGPAGLSCAHRLAVLGHGWSCSTRSRGRRGLNEYGLASYKTPGRLRAEGDRLAPLDRRHHDRARRRLAATSRSTRCAMPTTRCSSRSAWPASTPSGWTANSCWACRTRSFHRPPAPGERLSRRIPVGRRVLVIPAAA